MYFGYYSYNGLIFCQRWDSDMPQKYDFKAKWILPEKYYEISLDELKNIYPCPRELIDLTAETRIKIT